MISADNKKELEEAELSFILVAKTPDVPHVNEKWRRDNPGENYEHDQIWLARDPGHGRSGRKEFRIIYHYSADRAHRTRKGLEEQIHESQGIANGRGPVKKNSYVQLGKIDRQVNQELVDKHRALARIKTYETNRMDDAPMQIWPSPQIVDR